MAEEYITYEEINDQPTALTAIADELSAAEGTIRRLLEGSSRICITGCGTSYYLSQAGSELLNRQTTSVAIPGSEAFISEAPGGDEPVDMIIPVSRSGESTETVRATEALIDRYPDATVLGITCTDGSTLDELSDTTIVSPSGSEESVVMTKSFSSMLLAFEYLAGLLREDSPAARFDMVAEESTAMIETADPIARTIGSDDAFEKFFFLGAGPLYGLAAEGMLKLEEMTLSWTKAYHALEFRHGPQSIVGDDTVVTVLLPGADEYFGQLLEDITDLGATTVAVGPEAAVSAVTADYDVTFPSTSSGALPLYAPFFQLLGYHRAVSLGLNPDEPQNLTQVVRL